MDPHHIAQDVHRCEICEAVRVHSHCDFCHVNLCKSCIGEHISDDYEKHKIVPFQLRETTLIYPKCELHPHKKCDLQCIDCNIFVCTICMASKQHKEHAICILDDVYNIKKENIKESANELQNLISPTYEEIAHDLETQIANLDKGYENLTTEISKQGEEWHKEIYMVTTKMKTEINEIKVKHRDILQKHLDEIKQIQSLIQQAVQSLKEIDESNELSVVIEYISKSNEFKKLPPQIKVSLPTFIRKPISKDELYGLFGQITPLSTTMEQQILLPKKQPKPLQRMLLNEAKIDATIQTFHRDLRNIACVNDEKIWTSGETDEIKYFNMKGLLLQTIQTESGEAPNDIAVDIDGNLLYSDWSTRTVNKVKNEQTEELVRLEDWTPCYLCITSYGDLLVIMYSMYICIDDLYVPQSKVVRYSGSTAKQTIQFDEEGKPLYSENDEIKCIAENRNHDICVADYKDKAIVVVNQAGKLRWRYTGHPLVTKMTKFKPFGITTDSQSCILAAEKKSNCIHILDQDGWFLRYIDNCDLKEPWGLSVDSDDNLFVCEYASGNVKKIKYLK